MRFVPILGFLALLALVPGALAHHCFPDENEESGSDLSVQTTSPSPSFSIVLVAASIVVPIAVVGAVVAALRAPKAVAPASGRWVCTPTSWVWVPDHK